MASEVKRMSQVDADALKAADAVLAVLAVAASNFPAATNVVVSADGGNTARFHVEAYILRRLITAGRDALGVSSP